MTMSRRAPSRSQNGHGPAQHAGFGGVGAMVALPHTLAGHHDDEPRAVALGLEQESPQRHMGLRLRHAVQVERRIDRECARSPPCA